MLDLRHCGQRSLGLSRCKKRQLCVFDLLQVGAELAYAIHEKVILLANPRRFESCAVFVDCCVEFVTLVAELGQLVVEGWSVVLNPLLHPTQVFG